MKNLVKNRKIIQIWFRRWILAVDFFHKKCQFAPRYTGGRCTIQEYRGGGGMMHVCHWHPPGGCHRGGLSLTGCEASVKLILERRKTVRYKDRKHHKKR